MSKNKRRTKAPSRAPMAEIILRNEEGSVVLSAGRNTVSHKDDDSIYLMAHFAHSETSKVSLILDEAEDFLDATQILVSDTDSRPFCGTLTVDTRSGSSGARLDVTVSNPHDEIALVKILDGTQEVTVEAPRPALERFLFAVREGLCEDPESDD